MGLYRPKSIFKDEKFHYLDEVDFQLYSFMDYIKITEQIIEKEIKEKINKYKKFLREASNIEIEFQYDVADYMTKIHIHQLYYNSLFISLYSFMEKKMYQLCKIAEKNQTIKINDLGDDGIYKYYKYLKKVLHIDLDELNTDWDLLTNYNKLRNRLVHFPDNTIEKSKNNTKQIVKLRSISNLKIIDKENYIEFEIENKQFLIDFWEVINNFLNKVFYDYEK